MRSSTMPFYIQILNQLRNSKPVSIFRKRDFIVSSLLDTCSRVFISTQRYLVRVTEAMYETYQLNDIFLYNVSLERVRWGGNRWEFVSPSGNVRPTSEGVGGLSQWGFAIVGHGRVL